MAKKTVKTAKKTSKQPISLQQRVTSQFTRFFSAQRKNVQQYLDRRPHRSFRLTRRRDYVRSLKLPGYWSFTFEVARLISRNKRLFIGLLLFYAVLNALFVGLSSQETYQQIADLLSESGKDLFVGGWGQIGQAGLLVFSGISGTFAPTLGDVQQVYALLIALLTWLTTVWILRALLSGKTPRLRDGIYNAGAPIVPTGLVLLVFVLQLVPLALVSTLFGAATTAGIIPSSGLLAMVSWIALILLAVLTLYWCISTLVAMIVVTLPGMYPWQAIRAAGDLVIGRRARILLRVLWLMGLSLLSWVFVILPTILLDKWVKSLLPAIEWLPLVPIMIAVVSSVITVAGATYMYVLYRKVVDDDAKPA